MITNLNVRRIAHYCEPERYVFVLIFKSERAKFSAWADIPVYEDYSQEEIVEYANIVQQHIDRSLCDLIEATKEWHSRSKCSSYHSESETVAELISVASSLPAVALETVLETVHKVYYLDDYGSECKVDIETNEEVKS